MNYYKPYIDNYGSKDEISSLLNGYFKGIYDNRHLIILFIDTLTGDILDANAGAKEFYGYSRRRFCRKKIQDISVDECSSVNRIPFEESDRKKTGKYLARHCLANGDIRDVEILEAPVFIKNRLITFMIVYDVTDKLKEEQKAVKDAKFYTNMVEFSPSGIAVLDAGIIKYVNAKAMEIYKCNSYDMLIGREFENTIVLSMRDKALEYIKRAEISDKQLPSCELKIIKSDNSITECEFDAAKIMYGNKVSVQLVFRDVTEKMKDLRRASGIQQQRMETGFPLKKYGRMETIYLPANDVSGDFYELHKIDEKKIIGIIGDVAGKGITAALDTTALKVMFNDGIGITHKPDELLTFLNRKVEKHMENYYVAASCFVFDFERKKLNISGGGINQFAVSRIGSPLKQIMMKGAYLGMFEDSRFENKEIDFESGDRFYFYTDGFEMLLDDQRICEKCAGMPSIEQLKTYLYDMLMISGTYHDDSTMMLIEII